jgi:lytic murein transglycosylase
VEIFVTLKAAVLAAGLLALIPSAQAQDCGETAQGFGRFIKEMKREADAAGISPDAVSVLNSVKYDPGIIKKDRAQQVFAQDFLTFQARMATQARVKKGQAIIAQYGDVFERVEQEYGVQAPVIAAFWALETDFGGFMGDTPIIQSIATLAWDCRRPEKFRPQLIAALQLLDAGDLPLEDMRGAWAGELGQTQFMAYDYNESAVDFDGDGKRDLIRSVPDVIASTANLLRNQTFTRPMG